MKKVLEDLIFLGSATETVKVFGKEWKLKTLNSEEQLEVSNNTSGYETLSRIFALKLEILSRSVIEIDGVTLTEEDNLLEFFKKLQPVLINKLYDEYEKLQQKQADSLKDLDEIKN